MSTTDRQAERISNSRRVAEEAVARDGAAAVCPDGGERAVRHRRDGDSVPMDECRDGFPRPVSDVGTARDAVRGAAVVPAFERGAVAV